MGGWGRRGLGGLVLLLLVLVAGCGAPAGAAVRVEKAWALPALAGGAMPASNEVSEQSAAPGTGAVFCTLVNSGRQADRLVSASSDAASTVEIHRTIIDGDVMRMVLVPDGIEIPAGKEVELRPGGYHVMLIGLRRDLKRGDGVTVVLQLESGGPVTVEAVVRDAW